MLWDTLMNFITLYYLLNATQKAQRRISKDVSEEWNSIVAVLKQTKFGRIEVQWLFCWSDALQWEFKGWSHQNRRYFE